ncbi:MAG: carbohydrate ABC transporter permease [Saccharofermentanales bacterium]
MKKLSVEKKKKWVGFSFITPWLLGFVFLFLAPLIKSLIYTVNYLSVEEKGFAMQYIGIQNYKDAFLVDPEFFSSLIGSVKNLLYQVPLILIFSLIIALLLNQKFRGRLLARAIFFVPVIIASGVIIKILNGDTASALIKAGEKSSNIFKVAMFTQTLLELGLTAEIVNLITSTANSIFELSWRSGVQILLFLAGMQTVSASLYEAADIDGCTAWEKFWKITFPMISPMLIVNVIYTITDSFTSYTNQTMVIILNNGQKMKFAYSATQAWIYFAIIMVILSIVYLMINRRVAYLDT